MTVDQVPLEWCFGDGVWIDLSLKKPGDNINDTDVWLGDHGIRVVGIDATIWDSPAKMQISDVQKGLRPHSYMQAHRAAGEKGMCIIEWLTNLDLLPHSGFTLYTFPVKVERGWRWLDSCGCSC